MEPGTKLGPYEIVEPLGKGGMGEVYLATDTRLGRQVAVKVLPAEFASDRERLARFEQEARAAAALSHPHIAAVHDVGTEDGTHFMVQEYLEGQSLRERLERGALPLTRGLTLGVEIGQALAAAHDAGIIHRDLKPDNVFITTAGHAKVLDFGLAKLTEVAATPAGQMSMSPTLMGTVAGQVMGTAGYMSPEQVQADADIDHRADLFAFGCLLYEMVSGRRAFAGETVLDTLHAIARTEPRALAEIKPELPAELQRILRKCLAKDPGARYQAAADLVVDLRTLAADVDSGTALSVAHTGMIPTSGAATGQHAEGGAARGRPWTRGRLALLAILPALAVGLAVGALAWFALRPPPDLPIRFEIDDPPYADSEGNGIFVSPDGRTIVFGAMPESASRSALHVRTAGSLETRVLPDTGVYAYPFFSPDGQWLAFRRASSLMKASLSGGSPSLIHELPERPYQGGAWSPEGWILFSAGGSLYRIPEDGSEAPTLVVEADPDLGDLRHPDLLPGGRAALVTLWRQSLDDAGIGVADLETGEVQDLHIDGSDPQYMPTGHLVWVRDDALLAVPFDPGDRQVAGPRGRVQEGIEVGPAGPGKLGISAAGTLAYSSAGASADFSLVWIDRQGDREPILTELDEEVAAPRLSPDGRRIAMSMGPATLAAGQVWIYEIDDRTFHPLTTRSEAVVSNFPVWSTDGASLFYLSTTGEEFGVFQKPADFTGGRQLLYTGAPGALPVSLTPDGRELAMSVGDLFSAVDIAVARLDGSGDDIEARVYLDGPFNELSPMVSPDGRWLAYVSNVSGNNQVYVRPFPEPGERRQISTDGGTEPRWSPDGRELFYKNATAMMAVDVSTGSRLEIGARRQLFVNARAMDTPNWTNYDVDADGQRFLMAERGSGETNRGGVVVVLNWLEELKRRVPVNRRPPPR